MSGYTRVIGVILGISIIVLSLINACIVATEVDFKEPVPKSIEKMISICSTVIVCLVIIKLTYSIFFYKKFDGFIAMEIFLYLLFQLILIVLTLLKLFRHYIINFVFVTVSSALLFAYTICISNFYQECEYLKKLKRELDSANQGQSRDRSTLKNRDCVIIPLKETGKAGTSDQRKVSYNINKGKQPMYNKNFLQEPRKESPNLK